MPNYVCMDSPVNRLRGGCFLVTSDSFFLRRSKLLPSQTAAETSWRARSMRSTATRTGAWLVELPMAKAIACTVDFSCVAGV